MVLHSAHREDSCNAIASLTTQYGNLAIQATNTGDIYNVKYDKLQLVDVLSMLGFVCLFRLRRGSTNIALGGKLVACSLRAFANSAGDMGSKCTFCGMGWRSYKGRANTSL